MWLWKLRVVWVLDIYAGSSIKAQKYTRWKLFNFYLFKSDLHSVSSPVSDIYYLTDDSIRIGVNM